MPIREVNNSLLAIRPMCRCAEQKFTIQNVNFYKYSLCLCGMIGLLKRVVNILHLLHYSFDAIPPIDPPNHPPMGGGMSTNHKSSNRIELSRLGQDLLNF